MTIFIDFSAPKGATTLGGPPPKQSETHPELMFCPKCLVQIDAQAGYGLAYGGMGVYWSCEECDWFYKVLDAEESE